MFQKYSISDEYYKNPHSISKKGAARGLVVQGLNSRLDMDEFETGLMRIAQKNLQYEELFISRRPVFGQTNSTTAC
ncbi:hypothetical protein GCM10020331_015730 [Ectobacillus funiculus]